MTFMYCEKHGIRLPVEVCKARGCPHAPGAEEKGRCPFVTSAQKKIEREARKREAAKIAKTKKNSKTKVSPLHRNMYPKGTF